METVDDKIIESSLAFMDKAKKDGKPFFVWHDPTCMHVFTHLSPQYKAVQSGENNYGLEEAGMAQLDDIKEGHDPLGLLEIERRGLDDPTLACGRNFVVAR
jgi:hypothetical protein